MSTVLGWVAEFYIGIALKGLSDQGIINTDINRFIELNLSISTGIRLIIDTHLQENTLFHLGKCA